MIECYDIYTKYCFKNVCEDLNAMDELSLAGSKGDYISAS